MSMDRCHSCRIRDVDVIDPQDNPDYPYRLCRACHQRLIGLCLRPLEYFNLVSKHGDGGHLHDDFYDELGNADQPQFPVFEDPRLAFPKLKESAAIDELIDHAIVAFSLSDELVNRLQAEDPDSVLDEINLRMSENPGLGYRLYEIVGKVLGPKAAAWVRNQIFQYSSSIDEDIEHLNIYAEMLAQCLPSEEGFNHCVRVLDNIESPRLLGEKLWSLHPFHSPKTLDWIEANVHRMGSLSSSWGAVAAASRIDWKRIVKWLEAGRPLSLIALDALCECSKGEATPYVGEWLRSNQQKLYKPALVDKMVAEIQNYLATDNVPRTRSQAQFILSNWESILKS